MFDTFQACPKRPLAEKPCFPLPENGCDGEENQTEKGEDPATTHRTAGKDKVTVAHAVNKKLS